MLAIDLKAAGIAPETDSGVVDFHALRGTYITHLVNSGASVKTCQTLARHSTPVLTIGVYAKTSLHDLTGAVEALPDLTPSEPASEQEYRQGTGTDGKHIKERFAHRRGRKQPGLFGSRRDDRLGSSIVDDRFIQ